MLNTASLGVLASEFLVLQLRKLFRTHLRLAFLVFFGLLLLLVEALLLKLFDKLVLIVQVLDFRPVNVRVSVLNHLLFGVLVR